MKLMLAEVAKAEKMPWPAAKGGGKKADPKKKK